jgi:threonine dehydrogenase-like Zn-dependent dehydrogenase
VVIVEPSAHRRGVATSVGIDVAVEPAQAAEAVRDLTAGRGADVVVESAGVPALVQVAVDSARQGGTVMLLGYFPGETPVNTARILAKEVTIRSAVAYTHDDFARVMGMMADGRIRVEPMHSRTVGLGGLPQALADLAAGGGDDVKILVDPRREVTQ